MLAVYPPNDNEKYINSFQLRGSRDAKYKRLHDEVYILYSFYRPLHATKANHSYLRPIFQYVLHQTSKEKQWQGPFPNQRCIRHDKSFTSDVYSRSCWSEQHFHVIIHLQDHIFLCLTTAISYFISLFNCCRSLPEKLAEDPLHIRCKDSPRLG